MVQQYSGIFFNACRTYYPAFFSSNITLSGWGHGFHALLASGVLKWSVLGKVLNMVPVESAIVTACHSGLGGTGDVAILSASNRMGLTPFARMSARIGGAAAIMLATVLLKIVHLRVLWKATCSCQSSPTSRWAPYSD